jgi:hypothetical protein
MLSISQVTRVDLKSRNNSFADNRFSSSRYAVQRL